MLLKKKKNGGNSKELITKIENIKPNSITPNSITPNSIQFLTAGNINTPSSRLICYENAKYLKKMGWDVKINKDPYNSKIIIFQKRFTPEDLCIAKQVKENGSKIILQLSEAYYLKSSWWEENILRFAEISDSIIVSTKIISDWFKKHDKQSIIIKTGLDFNELPKSNKSMSLKICWIGSDTNERYLKHVVKPINNLNKNMILNLE